MKCSFRFFAFSLADSPSCLIVYVCKKFYFYDLGVCCYIVQYNYSFIFKICLSIEMCSPNTFRLEQSIVNCPVCSCGLLKADLTRRDYLKLLDHHHHRLTRNFSLIYQDFKFILVPLTSVTKHYFIWKYEIFFYLFMIQCHQIYWPR